MNKRVYLAGPDVFFEDVREIANEKKALCVRHGFEGVFPLDAELEFGAGMSLYEKAEAISLSNEKLMDSCDFLIANLTPFRGASMDAGTAFEVGYMRAQKKIVLGYSNVSAGYVERVHNLQSVTQDNRWDLDRAGMEVESFGLSENLMIEVAIVQSGGRVETREVSGGELEYHLEGFEACLEQAKGMIGV